MLAGTFPVYGGIGENPFIIAQRDRFKIQTDSSPSLQYLTAYYIRAPRVFQCFPSGGVHGCRGMKKAGFRPFPSGKAETGL